MEAGAVRSARYELTTTHFVSNLMGSVHCFTSGLGADYLTSLFLLQ